MTRLFHYTCEHSAPLIAATGILRPNPQPALGDVPLVWLTDLDFPVVEALGLTSKILRCDRTAYRVEVDTAEPAETAMWWAAHHGARVAELDQLPGLPMHWYVSELDVPILRVVNRRTGVQLRAKAVTR